MNAISRLTTFVYRRLRALLRDSHILVSQAITLAVLSLAFPNAVQLGSNILLSSLLGALFVTISLVAAVMVTYILFDYTKEGEYKLAFGLLSLREKLTIFAATIGFAALTLQLFSLLFPAVMIIASYPIALGVGVACEIVSLGIERVELALTDTQDDEGPTRQGKRKPKHQ